VHLGAVHEQALTGHFLGLRKTHDGQARGRDIGQATLVTGDIEFTLVASDDERDGVGGVGGVGRAGVRVNHLLGVTVIGGDGEDVAGFLACVVDGLDGLVGGGDGLDGGIKVTSVADLSIISRSVSTADGVEHSPTYHVGRSKVAHDKLVFTTLDDLGNLVRDTLGIHLGLLVVCRDLGRGDHLSVFVFELLFHTSVEEKGDVGVLFGFYR
jgi:hypothetical protein